MFIMLADFGVIFQRDRHGDKQKHVLLVTEYHLIRAICFETRQTGLSTAFAILFSMNAEGRANSATSHAPTSVKTRPTPPSELLQ